MFPEELELCGPLTGRRVVHLQCNCGQDSLSLAREGAEVSGIDISDVAIDFAAELSAESGIVADFLRADLLQWFDDFDDFDGGGESDERFDLAFSTYGTIGWLSDLDRWARGVAKVLRPGGRLVLLEFHPLVWSLCPDPDSYFHAGVIAESGGVNDYVGEGLSPSGYEQGVGPTGSFANPEPAHTYQWTVANIVQATIDAGLQIETLREYPYANGCRLFEGMRELPGRRYAMPEGAPDMPLMLGLVARRPSSATMPRCRDDAMTR